MKNLQIGDNDLIGNKFNGNDLHKYLRDKKIDSSHLVWNKESNDENTYLIAGEKIDREVIKQDALDIQTKYSLNSILNPLAYDILYNKLFLEADVVHFHLIHNFIFDLQLLPVMSRLKPIVWTIHDPWSLGGHCIHHFDCNKWKSHCGNCPNLFAPFALEKDNSALNFELKKEAIKNSNLNIIVASEWMKNMIEESPVFKGKKINVIPFGIDQNIFKPIDKTSIRKKLGIPEKSIVISFRCDYSKFKGMDFIEYVLKKLKTKKKIYLLLLAGDFNNKGKPKFKNKSYGWVKDDYLLRDIYNASDLFLMPSKMETFGMMAIEAMSCGVLPIVLDDTSLSTVTYSSECGVSVKRDKKEYLKVVKHYIDNDNERIERANKCLGFARKHYNKDVYVDKIIDVYKKSIKNHKMSKNDKYLLDQLKKYMTIDPSLKKTNEVNVFDKLSILENKNNTLVKDFEELENKNNTLVKDFEELENKNNTLVKDFEELENKNNTLVKDFEELENKNSDLKNTNISLKKQVKYLNVAIEAYKNTKIFKFSQKLKKITKYDFVRKYLIKAIK